MENFCKYHITQSEEIANDLPPPVNQSIVFILHIALGHYYGLSWVKI
jgi:hypothetical protein